MRNKLEKMANVLINKITESARIPEYAHKEDWPRFISDEDSVKIL